MINGLIYKLQALMFVPFLQFPEGEKIGNITFPNGSENNSSTINDPRVMVMRSKPEVYPFGYRNKTKRFKVPKNMSSWDIPWPSYDPPYFTAASAYRHADPNVTDNNFKPKWNSVDGTINRTSCIGPYRVVNNYPLNPLGRTGVAGRGVLRRWGPNHQANLIFTRYKLRKKTKTLVFEHKCDELIVQVLLERTRSARTWHLPKIRLKAGDVAGDVWKVHFRNHYVKNNTFGRNVIKLNNSIDELFANRSVIFSGYFDDPVNTDNAWVETVALHLHDDAAVMSRVTMGLPFIKKRTVKWTDVKEKIKIYRGYYGFIRMIASKMQCYWK